VPPLVIAIAGGTGSGKSFLSDRIIESIDEIQGNAIEIDSYYRDLSDILINERELTNFDHPDSFEFDLLHKHIKMIKAGGEVNVPVYDYKTHTRTKNYQKVIGSDYIIINGIMGLHDQSLRSLFDLSIFIDIDSDIRLSRRIKRDMRYRKRTLNSIINQYLESVKIMHDRFVEPTIQFADMVIKDTGRTEIDSICTKIRFIYDSYAKK
tara:strand:- start:62 stop:685 length:624 start_codon:yes stop_codon:yes gene_type:complete